MVSDFIAAFPEEFEGINDVVVGMTNFPQVLVVLGRFELLSQMITATIRPEESNPPGHNNAIMPSMRAGHGITGLHGQEQAIAFMNLLPPILHPFVQQGIDVALQQAAQ